MPVIAIATAPGGVTRVFFDCRETAPDPEDQLRIERAMTHAKRHARAGISAAIGEDLPAPGSLRPAV